MFRVYTNVPGASGNPEAFPVCGILIWNQQSARKKKVLMDGGRRTTIYKCSGCFRQPGSVSGLPDYWFGINKVLATKKYWRLEVVERAVLATEVFSTLYSIRWRTVWRHEIPPHPSSTVSIYMIFISPYRFIMGLYPHQISFASDYIFLSFCSV